MMTLGMQVCLTNVVLVHCRKRGIHFCTDFQLSILAAGNQAQDSQTVVLHTVQPWHTSGWANHLIYGRSRSVKNVKNAVMRKRVGTAYTHHKNKRRNRTRSSKHHTSIKITSLNTTQHSCAQGSMPNDTTYTVYGFKQSIEFTKRQTNVMIQKNSSYNTNGSYSSMTRGPQAYQVCALCLLVCVCG